MGLEKPTSFRDKLSIIVYCNVSNKKGLSFGSSKKRGLRGPEETGLNENVP
jgi:hypothetical protein